MGEILGALTVRGRGLIAAGLAAFACGYVLGERDLVAIGLTVALIPVGVAAWLVRRHDRLSLERDLSAGQVEAGRPFGVGLTLRNGGAATPTMMLEEQLPYALGPRPRFTAPGLAPGEQTTMHYSARSDTRGIHEVGPLRVLVGDPFGLALAQRRFSSVDSVVVTPAIERLPPIVLAGAVDGHGDSRPHSFVGTDAADVTVREYRLGDDLRRVHWRSTAHAGELMVRREERPWQPRCTVLLDNRACAHHGRAQHSSLETAIRAAASIILHLSDRGYQVRLVDARGDALGHGSGETSTSPRMLLAALAAAAPIETLGLGDAGSTRAPGARLPRLASDSILIAVLGATDSQDRTHLEQIGRLGAAPYAIVLDVDRWDRADPPPLVAPGWLRAAGWRATDLAPGQPLAQAWRELAR